MASSSQLNLPPMLANQVGSGLPSEANKVGTTPLVDLAYRAFVQCGKNAQQSAAELGMNAADFSKAFSVNWPERNGVMKKWDKLPFEIRRTFAALLMADYDLTAPDAAQTKVIREFAQLLKAVNE